MAKKNVAPPAPPTEEELAQQAEQEARDKLRTGALKALIAGKRARAWQLHAWPMEKFVLRQRARLHLPRSYLSRDGEDVQMVYPGTDINQLVHQYYLESVNPKSNEWVNFVHADDVTARRHEFLGPAPRVAGYDLDRDGQVYIRWWDEFLSDQWTGTQKWKLEVVWSDEDGAWVEKTD
ncbi:hypothetical protein C8R46DRAFT_269038 [Mycena filopes]|nr:hypothetical protein C8R46DRAFT_269038 [Mycena filopes]